MHIGHSVRVGFAVLALVVVVQAGPIGITRYSGQTFPYSAGFHTLTGPPDQPNSVRAASFVSTTAERAVDVLSGSEPGASHGWTGRSTIASAVDPAVFYARSFAGGSDGIDVVRIVGSQTQVLRTIQFRRLFGNTFGGFIEVKRDAAGSDVVYYYASVIGLAAIHDRDGDGLAESILDRDNDGYDDHVKFGDFGVLAVSGDGTGYGFEYVAAPFPHPDRVFGYTVRDTDGDLVPDTPVWPADPRGRIDIPGASGYGFYGGAIDAGTGRLVLGFRSFYATLDVDGEGFPIADSMRPYGVVKGGGEGPLYDYGSYYAPAIMHDGSLATLLNLKNLDTLEQFYGVYVLDDADFSGEPEVFSRDMGELFPALTTRRFDPLEYVSLPSSHELSELQLGDSESKNIDFADFGVWPDGRAFSFRQTGIARTSVDVSDNGLLSFVGPVSASPSLGTLDGTPGLVAPAWSDQWDTSQARIFAGCAPVQRRFADGSGTAALSFVVEWRGLISPNGKRTNLRCLLLEDGSFRVDYGAMEIGDMPIVVGYSTDGTGAIVADDLSDNSWGGSPAGTLDEAKLGEEFGAARPFDLAHKWVRFAGYGDVRGPRPELIGVALKNGNKIQMKAAGSNIQPGATLVVDGAETFELAKSATGSKWVVTKKARSTPGATSVAAIWDDGAAHSIVVVNPDGARSQVLSLQ